jgi:DNA repair protein RadC
MLENKTLTIKQWAEDDRPREKLASIGAEYLSQAELLAIIINNGSKEKSALDLAKEILSLAKNNLDELGKLTITDLQKIKGIGQAKAIAIAAALEIGRRRSQETAFEKDKIGTYKDASSYLRIKLKDYKQEVFAVMYLNNALKILDFRIISRGGIVSTVVDTRLVFQPALELGATCIIICHNHPSGSLQPSEQDIKLTEKIKQAGRLLDIKMLDHVIVSDEGYYSFEDGIERHC